MRPPRSRPAGRASAAAPKPAMAATFSVPARNPSPARRPDQPLGDLELVGGQDHAPRSLRPPILWAERVSTSTPSSAMSTGILPAACDRIGMDQPAMRVDEPGRLGHRLEHAGLVVGELTETRTGAPSAPSQGAFQPGRDQDAVRIDRDDFKQLAGKRWPLRTQGCSVAARAGAARRRPSRGEKLASAPGCCLGPAAGEDDILLLGADEARHLLAGRFRSRPARRGPRHGRRRRSGELGARAHGVAQPRAAGARWHCGRDRCAGFPPWLPLSNEILAIAPGCLCKAPHTTSVRCPLRAEAARLQHMERF